MDIIYKYEIDEDNEKRIQQGDIFYNLPLRTIDLMIKSVPENTDEIEDQSDLVLKDVIINSKYILTESFIYPSWGILASQDCDIRPDYDLIFYPLVQTKSPREKKQLIRIFLENGIRKPTRKCYVPKIKSPDKPEFGPSYVLFQTPFIVPYNLLNTKEIYEKSWCARILNPARMVLLGKITSFYCRTPMDEYIFLSNSELTDFIEEKWNEYNGEKKTLIETIENLTELRDALLYNNRRQDLQSISFVNKFLVNQFKKYLTQFYFRNEDKELVNICNEILSKEPKISNEKFHLLIKKLYIEENCLIDYINSPSFSDQLEIIKNLKEGNFIEPVLPPNIDQQSINEIKNIGFAAESSIKQLKKYKETMLEFYRFFHLVLFNEIIFSTAVSKTNSKS